MTYLLDTNVLVNAKRDHYGFDFCPGFWDWIDTAHAAGVVASVEAVYDEIIEYADQLADWARERRGFFLTVGAEDVDAIAAVNRWAIENQRYTDAAKQEFASAADSFLIAQAMTGGHTVVTHEVIRDKRTKIQIPNAAAELGVACCLPWKMLREEQPRFVLGSTA